MANQFADGRFRMAVGIEDTFVPQVTLGRRSLDEYELIQHYHYWHDDLRLARECGATTIRYGLPWYLLNPERGRFVWDWVDRVVDRLEELGFETIVDLIHYGCPHWLDNAFLNADYPAAFAEYAARVGERYRGGLTAFTPANEPIVNAMWCGELGLWPPYLKGDDGFVKLLRALVRGIVATQHAVAETTAGEATFVHVESSFRHAGDRNAVPERSLFLERRSLLAEDLVTGGVDDDHPLAPYLREHGFHDDDFAWSAQQVALPDVMGVNYYPHLSTSEFIAGSAVTPQPLREGGLEGLEDVLRTHSQRYGCPVFLTETSMVGDHATRIQWLDDSLDLLLRLREEGVDVAGYTWWPLFHYVDWVYREGERPVAEHLVPMGMYDLRPSSVGVFERVRTPVVGRFAERAAELAAQPV